MVRERRAFGERLKQQRERCGASLQSISQATKVPASLYGGLERGDCSRWPGGIYSRAYIKAYAEAIGLNAADVICEFSAIYSGTPGAHAAGGPSRSDRANALRLGLAEEPVIDPDAVMKRAALASVDLVIGSLIAALVGVGLGASGWITIGSVLAYFVVGRLISDEPLLFWIYMRLRSASVRTSPAPPSEEEEVRVGDAASTAA